MKALLRCAAAALILLACFRPAFTADLMLDVKLDPSTRNFDAVAELVASEDVTFALHGSLSVRQASVDGRAVKPTRVPFHKDTFHVASRRVTGSEGAHRVRRHAAGARPRARPPRRAGRNAADGIVEGSFLPAGSGWYPHPRGFFTYAVTLSVPADQRALVAGTLVSESESAGRYVARFEFTQPTDGIDLMAGTIHRAGKVGRDGKQRAAAAAHVFPS